MKERIRRVTPPCRHVLNNKTAYMHMIINPRTVLPLIIRGLEPAQKPDGRQHRRVRLVVRRHAIDQREPMEPDRHVVALRQRLRRRKQRRGLHCTSPQHCSVLENAVEGPGRGAPHALDLRGVGEDSDAGVHAAGVLEVGAGGLDGLGDFGDGKEGRGLRAAHLGGQEGREGGHGTWWVRGHGWKRVGRCV